MKKKLIAVLLLIFIILSIGGNYIYLNYKKITIANYTKRLQQGTNDYSEFLKNEIYTINSILKNTSVILLHQIDNHKAINEEIVETFQSTTSDLPLITSIYFVGNKDGIYINNKGIKTIESLDGYDFRKRPWYLNATASFFPVNSEVYSDLFTNKPVITLSYALRSEGKLLGVIAADLYLEDINNVYGFISDSKDTKYYILDSKKNIIVHSLEEVIGLNVFSPEFKSIYRKITNSEESFVNNGFDNISRQLDAITKEGEVTYQSLWGFRAYGYCRIIPETNWYLIGVADIDSILRNYLFILTAISLATVFIIGFILYKWIYAVYYKDMNLNCYTINRLMEDINTAHEKKDEKILLFIDIHGFTDINRKYGARSGDEILKKFVYSIKSEMSRNEYLAHMGSDDFILVFKKNNWEYALKKSKLIYEKFCNNTFKVDGQTIQLSSFMALIKVNSSHLINKEKSINTIRRSLEKIKNKYLKELVVFSDVNDFIAMQAREKENRNLILEAIANEKVVPFFQPIYDLQGDHTNKYEVLMRIKEGDSFRSPAPYIKIAEENDLIKELDLVILEKALKYKKQFDKEDLIQLSVNLSGKELSDFDHLLKVIEIIDKFEINHENIIFEITETQHIEDLTIINQWITSMKSKGFKFSIDDFGSGYASIEYLNSLSVDYVKIDGKFIKDMLTSNKSYYLVESLVKMAKAFDLKIVAEFVENEEILAKINDMEIDYAQGYYFGKPKDEFLKSCNENE